MATESTKYMKRMHEDLVSEAQARRDFSREGTAARGGDSANHNAFARHKLELRGDRQIGWITSGP
ncbi:hypothetical protein MPLB_1870008 [Mesorhizobium sp. ORS 3324]|nr:hypothetical protein MPLB_1870008 [Mesorhizobium sp. ORS 3324]